jgi:hypothetical protein
MDDCFMYGDLTALDAEPAPVMTVLLIGFQGQRKVLTGTRDELWREYLHGDGGHGCNGVRPIGWEYWCPQPLLVTEREAVADPKIESIHPQKD